VKLKDFNKTKNCGNVDEAEHRFSRQKNSLGNTVMGSSTGPRH
jgi:hypothetical protein